MTDSKSVALGRGGSSPPTGTTFEPQPIGQGFFMPEKVVGGLERHAGRGTEASKSPPTGTTFMTPANWLGFFYA